MDSKKIKALINLLDDPDKEIFKTVKQSLLDEGASIIPELEKAWEVSPDVELQSRIEEIIQHIHLKSLTDGLRNWKYSDSQDLLEGVFLIAKYQYPELKIEDIQQKIDVIKKDAWLELHENLTALEKVKILNHIIFDVHQFSINNTNFYAPHNSYINSVLDSKKGNPLSLAIIYTIVAQSLDIPIYGVNLPKNFILAYQEKISSILAFDENFDSILFYINPANKGAVFGRKEIDNFLKQQKIPVHSSYYKPCKSIDVLERIISNLVSAYEKLGNKEKISELNILLDVIKGAG